MLVQSCINSIGYPGTIREFRAMVEHRFLEFRSIYFSLNTDLFFDRYNYETREHRGMAGGIISGWTAPRWFTKGDISFFTTRGGHSRTLGKCIIN